MNIKKIFVCLAVFIASSILPEFSVPCQASDHDSPAKIHTRIASEQITHNQIRLNTILVVDSQYLAICTEDIWKCSIMVSKADNSAYRDIPIGNIHIKELRYPYHFSATVSDLSENTDYHVYLNFEKIMPLGNVIFRGNTVKFKTIFPKLKIGIESATIGTEKIIIKGYVKNFSSRDYITKFFRIYSSSDPNYDSCAYSSPIEIGNIYREGAFAATLPINIFKTNCNYIICLFAIDQNGELVDGGYALLEFNSN